MDLNESIMSHTGSELGEDLNNCSLLSAAEVQHNEQGLKVATFNALFVRFSVAPFPSGQDVEKAGPSAAY
jgi:hypothetical protein